ncbi:hypothetical protein [Mariniflexile sp.]|uniref:hypothetical protein n=1 Tax=Mariniflexile sp. TaxID=1979402 RepID=UPI003566F857
MRPLIVIMKKKKKLICFLACLILFSCEVEEVECKGFDKNNAILSYAMFPDEKEFYEFVNNQGDTIKLSFFDRYYSENYIERCGGYGDPTCDCFSNFEELYKVNDSIFFRTQVRMSSLEDETEFIELDYSVNASRYSENQIINSPENILERFSQITKEELIIDNHEFNNVLLVVLNKHINDKSLIEELIIEKDKGLVGFINNNELYVKN